MAESVTVAAHYAGCTLRPYQPGDEEGILRLFHRAFAQKRSLGHWRWKFQGNPEGRQIMLALSDGGEIVGQYAGIPVRVRVDGESFIFSQLVDNMVDRDYRRGLKKPGVFASLFLKFAEDYGGRDRAAIMYGFPTAENLRIGQRLLGYVPLHRVMKLSRSLGGTSHRPSWQWMVERLDRLRTSVRGVDRVDRFDESVDRLWARCEHELRAATVRDARYLNWRYAECPDVEYRLLEAGGAVAEPVKGLAVLRLGWKGQPVALLVDWLVPWGDWVTAGRLLKRVCQEAELAGMKELQAWMSPASAWHRYLLERGFQAKESDFIFVARTFTPAVSLEHINPIWYYTMGDSDIY